MTPTTLQTNIRNTLHKEKQQTQIKGVTQKTMTKNKFEERHIIEDRGSHSHRLKVEARKDWRKQMSPAPDQSLEWNQIQDGSMFGSPEHPEVASITSEATEELLKDDELDSSIIQKLKELNLAVNYNPDTQGKIMKCCC